MFCHNTTNITRIACLGPNKYKMQKVNESFLAKMKRIIFHSSIILFRAILYHLVKILIILYMNIHHLPPPPNENFFPMHKIIELSLTKTLFCIIIICCCYYVMISQHFLLNICPMKFAFLTSLHVTYFFLFYGFFSSRVFLKTFFPPLVSAV